MPLPPKGSKHSDWIFFLRWVPRRWTSYEYRPPIKLFGNQRLSEIVWRGKAYRYCKPIPEQGEYSVVWPLGFAWRTKGRWYFRFMPFGRFNDDPPEDAYYAFPSLTAKRW